MKLKHGWAVLLVLVGVMAPRAAKAQAELYGEFSVSALSNQVQTNYLYGATTGVLLDGPTFFNHMTLTANIQGRFVEKPNEKFNGVAAGPRLGFPIKKYKLTPYAEFLIGFARYNNPNEGGATTDSEIQLNGGIAKQLSPRWDAVVDFSYSEYYALGGEYNPKAGSVGVIYHFVKR